MRLGAFILVGVVLLAVYRSPAFSAVISGTDVNIRAKPDAASAVVGKLQSGDRVTVLEKTGSMGFAGMYLGRWCRIKSGSREGYVFSSFVREDGDADEQFHVFFQAFSAANEKGDLNYIRSRTVFPLTVVSCFEGNCTDSAKTAATLELNDLYMKKPFMYKQEFTYEKGSVHLFYGYEATRFNLYFKLQKGKWVLYAIRTSSC